MAWAQLKNAINNAIKANNNQEITGSVLNSVLNSIVNSMGKYATFAGVATPSTNPGVFEGPVVYFANTAGTYPNFGNITVGTNKIVALYNINGTWDSYEIGDNNITTSRIADKAVTSEKLADKAVTSEKLTDKAVTSEKLADNTVRTSNIAQEAVTGDKIATGTITEDNIQDKSLSQNVLADNAVNTAVIQDGAVTSEKLADSAMSAAMTNAVNSEAEARSLAISQEAQARTQNDESLNNAIVAEIDRAKAAEEANTQAIAKRGIYDVSAYNGGAVFESLSALLDDANLSTLIPASVRCGGMSIRFIQGSVTNSDNKYVQYMCVSDTFTTNTSFWVQQGEDVFGRKVSLAAELSIADENGFVISQFKNGEIKTKYFDSSHTVSDKSHTPPNILSIIDEQGNAILELRNGTISTKYFNSENSNGAHWRGKIWYAYGTSMTADKDYANPYWGGTETTGKYSKYVKQFGKFELVNNGVGGGGICANTNVKNRVMTMADGKAEADLITLEVSQNDFKCNLGTIYDTGSDTFCGALNQCIRYLQANTSAQIVVMCSSLDWAWNGELYPPEHQSSVDGHTFFDMHEAIRKVCMLNAVYYIPWGAECGLGVYRMSNKYIADALHQTELGGYNIAKYIWSRLKNIPLWYSYFH